MNAAVAPQHRPSPLIACIRWYQRNISALSGPRCRYYPTCSAYAIDAISEHGAVKGVILGAWRLVRCNPWARGGVDDVPESFRLVFHPHRRYPVGESADVLEPEPAASKEQ